MQPHEIWSALMRDGGITLRAGSREPVTTGKVVGRRPGTFIAIRDPHVGELDAALKLAEARSDKVGVWYDRETDIVHIDPVDVVTAPEEAERLAYVRQQLAWYDLDTRTEHRTGLGAP